MLKAKVLSHPYFKADVEISITQVKGNNTTACRVKFYNLCDLPNGRTKQWFVTIPNVYESALEALAVLETEFSSEGYIEVL